MGDKISISFVNGKQESVSLFSHWNGISLMDEANKYVAELNQRSIGKMVWPLERLEPNTVMLDFIRHLIQKERLTEIKSNYYLGKDEDDGDNSDNGHFRIRLNKITEADKNDYEDWSADESRKKI